jgi:hypothetical protein
MTTALLDRLAESFKRERARLEKECQLLIDLILGSSSPEIAKAYERRVSELERRKLLIDEKRKNLTKSIGRSMTCSNSLFSKS